MNKLLSAFMWLIKPHYGRNRLSRLLSHKLEGKSVAELVGIPLAGIAFAAAVVVPQTEAGFASTELYFDSRETTVNAVVAPARFRWPFPTFGISTFFSFGHPGLDLTSPKGTPVYPIGDGKVILTATILNGYGKHVIVEHPDKMISLYAHLSSIKVENGQHVTKETELGGVGATGWATGNHLHMEIYQKGVALNPMEILPEVKKYEPKAISQTVGHTVTPELSF